ncbi:MAG: sulfotransferase domain-containing protein [Opitutaceae bacterium]
MREVLKKIKRRIKNARIPNRRKVDFVICGTQKGGTSALDVYLREHPEICMADKKEVHFFDQNEHFTSAKPDYSKYHAYFRPNRSHKLVGEATPIYMYWNEAPKRIRDYNPNMKLIALLRNPIERAYSHWNMEHGRDRDDLPFFEAIKNEEERCREASPEQHRVYSYIDRGFYLKQLQNIWEFFPKDRLLVLKSDDLNEKPKETLDQVCDFLEVSEFQAITEKKVNKRSYARGMSDEECDYLKTIFKPSIIELESELNWDCSDWLS